jgi:hypothetical protein
MKSIFILSGLIVLILLVMACTVPRSPTKANMNDIAKSIVYFQDVKGICYASITSYTQGFQYVASITAVPCEKVGL